MSLAEFTESTEVFMNREEDKATVFAPTRLPLLSGGEQGGLIGPA